MQMSLETFRYIRHSTMSMMCLLCFFGAFMIVTQKKMVRSDMLFVLLLIFSGSTNLISLIKGFTTGYAGVVEYKFMSVPMLIYGSVSAYIFFLYPLEALRPGWLSLKRAIIIFLPILFFLILYVVEKNVFAEKVHAFDSWTSFIEESSRFNVLMSLLILVYPTSGVVVLFRYRESYTRWCENNFASMENIDIKWLSDYIFGYLVITLSSLIIVFSNNIRSVLMHSIIFLTFFLYGFYRVIFWKSPYPEDYFKDGMNESDVQLIEVEISRNDNILISDNDINLNKSFVDKLPGYKVKLEEWMLTEKPYLRKDFKLIDAMKILPLNRSYLSRLFNEGYGESFYHFVMRYRLEESKRLLLSRPDLNITNIAELSGFSSISVFGRAFHQYMNCSPMQWREKQLQEKK
jgi:AraC-like DNA-binding protein